MGKMTVGRLNNAGTGFPARGLPLAAYIFPIPIPILAAYI